MKLSLSLPALERLLAGDTELEVELRHQIARQFTKEHLLPLADSAPMQEVYNEIRNKALEIRQAAHLEIANQIGTLTRDGWSGQYSAELQENIKNTIKDYAERIADAKVTEAIKNNIDFYSRKWSKYVDDKVKEIFDRSIEEQVQAEINRRLTLAKEIK